MKQSLLFTTALILLTLGLFAQETSIDLPTADNSSSISVTDLYDNIKFRLYGDAGFYIGGSIWSGSIPVLPRSYGPYMIWYPTKSAFRAGYFDADSWNDENIGSFSEALGYKLIASGDHSTAMGCETKASGDYSTAMGVSTTASGDYSTAMGYYTKASRDYSTAMGESTTASGKNSFAAGKNTHASGIKSLALGGNTTAQAFSSVVLGRYNIVDGDTDSWVTTDPLLVCGNGEEGSPWNALTLYKNGNMTIAGTLTESSDIRLKEEIEPLKEVLLSLQYITPICYRFKDKKTHPAGRQIGFSAQEIEQEFPELVSKDSKGYLSVDYGHMTAVLLKAVKEQQEIITNKSLELEQAEVRIAGLEKKLSDQSNQLAAQEERINEMTAKFSSFEVKLNALNDTATNLKSLELIVEKTGRQ